MLVEVTELFGRYLAQNQLDLTGATGDPTALAVHGQLTLGSKTLVANAVFQADTNGANVAGIIITCQLPDWDWTSPNVQIAANSVATYLSSPELAFTAQTGQGPAATLSGTISIQGNSGKTPHTMTAPVPIPDPENPQTLVFSCEPQTPLDKLKDLAQFVAGADFDIIPPDIPLAPGFSLERVSLAVGWDFDEITSLACRIGSKRLITIIPDLLQIESFSFTLDVLFPRG